MIVRRPAWPSILGWFTGNCNSRVEGAEGGVGQSGRLPDCRAKAKNVPIIRRRRTTEITIEAEEIVTSYELPGSFRWCSECGKHVPMVGQDAAVRITGVRLPIFSRWISEKKVHVCTTSTDDLLICLASLGKQF